MPVTEQQRRAIVFLASQARAQLHGAPHWDDHGIDAAVRKVAHLHLVDVANAAMRAADDRSLKTPGAIGNPSAPCWQERKTDRPQPREPFDRGGFCGTCNQPEDRCRTLWAHDHEYESVHDRDKRVAAEKAAREETG